MNIFLILFWLLFKYNTYLKFYYYQLKNKRRYTCTGVFVATCPGSTFERMWITPNDNKRKVSNRHYRHLLPATARFQVSTRPPRGCMHASLQPRALVTAVPTGLTFICLPGQPTSRVLGGSFQPPLWPPVSQVQPLAATRGCPRADPASIAAR